MTSPKRVRCGGARGLPLGILFASCPPALVLGAGTGFDLLAGDDPRTAAAQPPQAALERYRQAVDLLKTVVLPARPSGAGNGGCGVMV
ncbi:hypothetical protein [Nonomuraea sp. NPDC049141]|uniref:hypothetical protein n=1 Tax=Nonomuraea sp. NPDC049141 TaxID=3155500 RepID=UPI0033CDF932